MPNKSLGQHWLFDSESLESICDAADLKSSNTVLEIGPGLGPLTKLLVAHAKQVIAVELDHELAEALPGRVNADNLQVQQGSILDFNFSTLPKGYKVAANVPYYLTSKIVRLLLEAPQPPSLAVLLVQKEVAQRLAAEPGDMSILGVSAQFYADVSLGIIVTADKFDPPPKVDSQVVILKTHSKPLFAGIDKKLFFRVVKAGFSEKRKTLRNSLSGGLHVTKIESEELLQKAGVSPGQRAEELTLDDWYKLTKVFAERP